MEAIVALANKMKTLNLQEIEKRVLQKHQSEIIDSNIEQLKRGEDAEGNKLPEYEYESYYKGKAAQGLLFNAGRHWNFILEGDFTGGFYVYQKQNNAIIDSRDSKRERLVRKVMPQPIFGLQDNELKELEQNYLIEEIEKEILNHLKL